MDTIGSLYNNSFDPSRPYLNFIAPNHDGATNLQFRISYTLQSAGSYILVVTTRRENVQGSFQITAVGPSSVYFYPTTITTDYYQLCDSCKKNTSTKKKTIAIVVPILIILIIITTGCCIHRYKRKRMSRHHQRREIDVPYTIPLIRLSDHFEEQPPPYESIRRI
ncbi:unnamed protein product [Adineta steineri]|uniref:Uncharacterized protein n=1 Tax=Adineta steineri TaxID=433720 RepID=A0A816DWP9_9BILA|nr:unnamed protein product [Adineta steineri]CAF1642360.1 unnamed protein product [Adineta steineri]